MLSLVGAQSISFGDVDYVPHPEVWMLLIGALSIAWFASRVLQPKAVAAGYDPITRNQRRWFVAGFLGMWLASDWPVHEIAENYLYSVHMLQHLLLSMLVPACFVLATPRWVLELVLRPGSWIWNWFRVGSKPLVAGLVFNGLTMFLHWSRVVQWSADSGPVHFGFHLLIFVSGLLMWMPVVGPIEEWKLKPLGQCIYLFCMSIVPTVPGGWLVFATGVVYRHYDVSQRLWGVDVLADQQAAGVVMKLFGGFILWAIILVIFARWAKSEMQADALSIERRSARQRAEQRGLDENPADQAGDETVLTYDDVSRAFAEVPAPHETN